MEPVMINKKIKAFAQETLGCGCSEEVFKTIVHEDNIILNNKIFITKKIKIGNRLLIYIYKSDDSSNIKEYLPEIIKAGINERDKINFNRFRLAVITDKKNSIEESLMKQFESIDKIDSKVHLHVLSKDESHQLVE